MIFSSKYFVYQDNNYAIFNVTYIKTTSYDNRKQDKITAFR
jgi:hypothetical protein